MKKSKKVANSIDTEKTVETPLSLLTEFLDDELRAALAGLGRVARESDEGAVEKGCDGLRRLVHLRRAMKSVPLDAVEECAGPRYLVAAQFLLEAQAAVTKTANEAMIFVTGPHDERGVFVLDRLVPIAVVETSRVHASPEPRAQLDALAELTEKGELLLATLHSHPGRGPDATHPSSTDLATQAQLERLGYPTIGAVFSRDRFVRFYTKDRPFAVVVSGSGSEQLGPGLFHLKGAEPKSALCRRFRR